MIRRPAPPLLALQARPYYRQRIRLIVKSGDLSTILGPVAYAANWQELESLAAQYPGSPAVVDPDLKRIPAPAWTRAGDAGACRIVTPPTIEYPGCDIRDTDDIRALELAVLQHIDLRRLHRLLARVEEQAPAGTYRIIRLFFHRAVQPYRIEELAEGLGVTERTLQRRCRSIGLPAPKKLFSLARAFAVTRILHWSRQPLRSVAFTLGFSDDANCHRLLGRVLGRSPPREANRNEMDRVDQIIAGGLLASSQSGCSSTSKQWSDFPSAGQQQEIGIENLTLGSRLQGGGSPDQPTVNGQKSGTSSAPGSSGRCLRSARRRWVRCSPSRPRVWPATTGTGTT